MRGLVPTSGSSDSHIICGDSTEVQRPRNHPAIKREKKAPPERHSVFSTLNLMVPQSFSLYHLSIHFSQKSAISRVQGMPIYTPSHCWAPQGPILGQD